MSHRWWKGPIDYLQRAEHARKRPLDGSQSERLDSSLLEIYFYNLVVQASLCPPSISHRNCSPHHSLSLQQQVTAVSSLQIDPFRRGRLPHLASRNQPSLTKTKALLSPAQLQASLTRAM